MKVGVSQITLHLPGCHSLKEKRQVIKSVMARVRQQFEVAIAEVDEQDRWQIARLGVSCVSNSSQHVDEMLRRFQLRLPNLGKFQGSAQIRPSAAAIDDCLHAKSGIDILFRTDSHRSTRV